MGRRVKPRHGPWVAALAHPLRPALLPAILPHDLRRAPRATSDPRALTALRETLRPGAQTTHARGGEATGERMDDLDALIGGLDRLAQDLPSLPAQASEPVHGAILSDMRAQAGQIPHDSGALRRSLTDPRDRTHIYERRGDVVRYGSTLPQASSPHVAPRIPRPSPQAIAQAVADALDDMLREAL